MVNLPYITFGIIQDTDDTNPDGAKVVLRNNTNGETTDTTTSSSGEYVLDAANLTSGYLATDRLTVFCAWGLAEKESSFAIVDFDTGHQVNLTLETVEESVDVTYAQIQDILDELGDKTTSDISYERVRKIILRAEKEIEERAGTSFSNTTVTDEIYDFNQYTSYKSPESLYFPRTSGYGSNGRGDSISGFMGSDTIKIEKTPIINSFTQLGAVTTTVAATLTVDSTSDFPSSGTICIYNSTNGVEQITFTGKTSTTFTGCTRSSNSTTASAHEEDSYVTMISISKNTVGDYQSDSWTDLEPQTGGGGDYLVYSDTGLIKFVNAAPDYGKRRIKVTYTYGYITVPKTVERLTILLSVRDVLISKGNDSQFGSIDSISVDGFSSSSGITGTVSYFKWLNEEIERLWKIVGDLKQSVA